MNTYFIINYFRCVFSSISDSDNDKLGVLPTSATGSLSSIITTSVASSAEQEPRAGRRGGGPDDGDAAGSGAGGDHDGDEKLTYADRPLIEEEWWKTTLQVSIPFFIAGIGTIGAGVILGRVEVSRNVFHICSDADH